MKNGRLVASEEKEQFTAPPFTPFAHPPELTRHSCCRTMRTAEKIFLRGFAAKQQNFDRHLKRID
jgi:hypothetical protein